MKKVRAMSVFGVLIALVLTAWGEDKPLLELIGSTPLPELHDGDFDHFTLDEQADPYHR
jgi:hypothetical protein